MPEFAEGYQAYQLDGAHRLNPYDSNSVSAQAWDRGGSAGLLHQRALMHLHAQPADASPETAQLDWLVRLIKGRR
jgi:hypothetical protein